MAERCFTAAGGTDKRYGLARRNGKVDVGEHFSRRFILFVRFVHKADVLKADVAVQYRRFLCIRKLGLRLCIKNLAEALEAAHTVLKLVNKVE